MNVNFKLARSLASGVLLGIALVGCASTPRLGASELLQKIEENDHEALAAYFANEAAVAKAGSERHQKMRAAYRNQTIGGRSGQSMSMHCDNLIRSYESAAAEYEAMANQHRQSIDRTKR